MSSCEADLVDAGCTWPQLCTEDVPCNAGTVTNGTADSTQCVGLTSACLSAGAPLVGGGGYKAASPWQRSSTTATVRQRRHTGAPAHSARAFCRCSAQIVGKREARAAAHPELGVRFACSATSHIGRCQTIGGRFVSILTAVLLKKSCHHLLHKTSPPRLLKCVPCVQSYSRSARRSMQASSEVPAPAAFAPPKSREELRKVRPHHCFLVSHRACFDSNACKTTLR